MKFKQRIVLAGASYRLRVQNKIRDATDFTKFTVGFVILIVLSSMLFCSLIFRTNMLYSFRDIDFFGGDKLSRLLKYNTSVISIIDWEPNNTAIGSIPGISGPMAIAGAGTGKSQCALYDVYSYPKELYDALQPDGEIGQWLKNYRWHSSPTSASIQSPDEAGIIVISALFHYLSTSDKYKPYGAEMACGIISNMFCESGGRGGIKQTGKSCIGWPIGEVRIHNTATLSAAKQQSNVENNVCGFGLCQYTSGDKLKPYLDCMEKYMPASGEMSDADIAAGELDYLISYGIDAALEYDKRTDNEANWTSAKIAGASWFVIYEMPGWRHGSARGYDILRGGNSEALWQYLKKYK